MKRFPIFLAFLSLMGISMAQDTVRAHVELRTRVVRRTVVDTMAAKVNNAMTALDLHGDVRSVTSRTYDYLTNTVTEEQRVIDEMGYCVSSTMKIGHLGSSGAYASRGGDMISGGNIEYTNVIQMTNTYKYGKLQKIDVVDMERGEYEIYFRYDLVGNVIGHDTVYDNEHHTDYVARFDRYHNPTYMKESGSGDEYTYRYQYTSNVHGQIASLSAERYNASQRTTVLTTTNYEYNDANLLVREVTNSDIDGQSETTYTYDPSGLVIRKDTKGETTKFEEIIERDNYGSCVLRKIVQDGRVILQIYNDVTYSSEQPTV